MKPTRICLIRHGETAWNAERRIQGQIDIGLSAVGFAQARAAAARLCAEPVAALYSSDLLRARQTAEVIAAALDLSSILHPEFRERRYGVFEGRTYDEARSAYPEDYAAFERRDPAYAFPSGGESLLEFHARVTAPLRALAARHAGQTVLLVTHGGVLDIVNRFVRGKPLDAPRDFLIPNAGISWLAVSGERWTLEEWGMTAHLADEGLDELR